MEVSLPQGAFEKTLLDDRRGGEVYKYWAHRQEEEQGYKAAPNWTFSYAILQEDLWKGKDSCRTWRLLRI